MFMYALYMHICGLVGNNKTQICVEKEGTGFNIRVLIISMTCVSDSLRIRMPGYITDVR